MRLYIRFCVVYTLSNKLYVSSISYRCDDRRYVLPSDCALLGEGVGQQQLQLSNSVGFQGLNEHRLFLIDLTDVVV